VVVALSAALCLALVGGVANALAGNKNAPWILGRASGITSYLLLTGLVLTGIALAHPWRSRFTRPSQVNRIRIHVAFAAFTAVFVVLHIVVLATDSYAGVGWKGTFIPMASTYRPLPITLGVIGLYAGLIAGITASLAGRITGRIWWPIHKVAALTLALIWAHGVLSGADTAAMMVVYVGTGIVVIAFAFSRYAARNHADQVTARERTTDDTQALPPLLGGTSHDR